MRNQKLLRHCLITILLLFTVNAQATIPYAYIANQGSDTISVIDTMSNTVINEIHLASEPYGVAINTVANQLYVTQHQGNSVSVINTTTNAIENTIAVGSRPSGVIKHPQDDRLYVSNSGGNTVSVIDLSTMAVIKTISVGSSPTGITLNPDGTRLYVSNNWASSVAVIDTATDTVMTTIEVDGYPHGIVVSQDGTRVYVTNGAGTMSVIDATTNTVAATVQIEAWGWGAALNPAGTLVYASNFNSNTVSVIDPETNTVIKTIPVGSSPCSIAFTPSGEFMYVTNNGSNDISVIDTSNHTVVATIGVSANPVSFGPFIMNGAPIIYVDAGPNRTLASDKLATAVIQGKVSPVGDTTYEYRWTQGDTVLLDWMAVGQDGECPLELGQLTLPIGTQSLTLEIRSNDVTLSDTTLLRIIEPSECENDSYAYIASEGSDTISVIDTISNTVINEIHLASGPYGVAINAVANQLYVTQHQGDSVSVINTTSNAIENTIVVGLHPSGVIKHPQDDRLYVSNSGGNTVSVIDLSTMAVIKTITVGSSPTGITLNPDGTRLYVSNNWARSVAVIDTATDAVMTTIEVDGYPHGIVVSQDGTRVYVTNGAGTMSVIDATTNTVAATVQIEAWGWGAALNPAGTLVYASNFNSNTVSVIDPVTNTVIKTIPVGSRPCSIAFTPSGEFMYVTNYGSNDISVIDTSNHTVVATIGVSANPVSFGNYLASTTCTEYNKAPIAIAGEAQSVLTGSIVTLDGTASSDPDLHYPLSYSWEFLNKPVGSNAALSDSTSALPTFTADSLGSYVMQLIVTDSKGLTSSPAQVLISTYNTPPVAEAGADQAVVTLGTSVTLDGSQSYDNDGDSLTYSWSIISQPAGSHAILDNPGAVNPTLIPDVHGTYVIQLKVADSWAEGLDSVTIGFDNIKPVSVAGGNQTAVEGTFINLDGSGSSDANLDPLTYQWSIVSQPNGANAQLISANSVMSSLDADLPGIYIVSLIVNDGTVDSEVSNVTILILSVRDSIIGILEEANTALGNLPESDFKNAKMVDHLSQKLLKVMQLVANEEISKAENMLEKDILEKTDGCTQGGAPDKKDWIVTCEGQQAIYSYISQVIEML